MVRSSWMRTFFRLCGRGIQRVADYFSEHPDSKRPDLEGPLLEDDLHSIDTQFEDRWRGEMWGTWGQAWTVPDRDCAPFSVQDKDGKVQYVTLTMNPQPIT